MLKRNIVMVVCAIVFGLVAVSGVAIADNAEKIDINTATVEELTQLEGIGDAYAKRIVEYRGAHGAFESVEALMNVQGIGEKTLEKNKDKITISDEKKSDM